MWGAKGSGKSTTFTKLAYKYLKKGYDVYTDDLSCTIKGVRLFNPRDLGFCYPKGEKQVLFIDEGGILYNNRSFAKFKEEWNEFYKLQRHAHCLVYIGSQTYDIDLKLKNLCDQMFRVRTWCKWLVCARRVIVKEEPIKNLTTGATDFVQTTSFAFPIPFLTIKYTAIPRWEKYHDSFKLPDRPELPYREID